MHTASINSSTDEIVSRILDDPVRSFNTLIKSTIPISREAQEINNISNDMLVDGLDETTAFTYLYRFLKNSVTGKVPVCSYYYFFSMMFLKNALLRSGLSAELKCVDIRDLAGKYVRNISDDSLEGMQTVLGIKGEQNHRAYSDAIVCGKIICLSVPELLRRIDKQKSDTARAHDATRLSEKEIEILKYIRDLAIGSGADDSLLRWSKTKSGIVHAKYFYPFFDFKYSRNGFYFLNKSSSIGVNCSLKHEPCSKSEGSGDTCRFFFNSIDDLREIKDSIIRDYLAAKGLYNELKNTGSPGESLIEDYRNVAIPISLL